MPRSLTLADLRVGLLFYSVSSAIVILSVYFGFHFVQHPPLWQDDNKDFIGALCRFDGNWYLSIVTDGYSFDPAKPSNVAFFPAYPATARLIQRYCGCRAGVATLLVAHFFLAATFVLLHAYLRIRSAQDESPHRALTLLAVAVFPPAFFFRLGYTESMFAFWCVLILFGFERRWHPAWLAIIAGTATATRAPGAALGFVVLIATWRRWPSLAQFVPRAIPIGLISGWGVIAFVAFQAYAFGEPLAFAQAQVHWNSHPNQSVTEAVFSLVTLEPIWSTYLPGSPRFWAFEDVHNHTPFSLQLANPIYFVLVAIALVWGWRKKYLTTAEVQLGLWLLMIPYLTRAYPNSLGSFGRFSSVVMPAFVVFGVWLSRLPAAWIGVIVAVAVLWLVAYSALFGAAWWLV